MNLKNYSPKDARLIRDNDGKTPDELLDLGLSQRGYRRMLEDNIAVKQTENTTLQPLSIEAVNLKTVAMPKTELPKRINLHNRKSGRVVFMGYKAAAMLAEKYPNEFELVA
jgi:hypothetical protein